MTSDASSSGPFGLPRVVFWGGSLLLLLLVALGVGFVLGTQRVDEVTQRLEQAEARAGESEARTAALEARLHAHEALALLYGTLLDVDARNFGIANERLDAATAALRRVNPEAFGAGAEELDVLLGELAALNVRVAADLAGQRATLSRLAQRLAEALGI